MERFGEAYTAQLENFARNVLEDRKPPITVDDGVEALKVAIAATRRRQPRARRERGAPLKRKSQFECGGRAAGE